MQWNRIKKGICLVIFAAIICFLFNELTWIFRGNNDEARNNLVGFKNARNLDVVLYGGSTLLRYYEPMEAWNQKGFTSYNYATSSSRTDLEVYKIQDSRATNEAKLYICDLRTITLTDENVAEVALRNWSDSLPPSSLTRLKGITSYLAKKDWNVPDVISYYLDLLKYHSNSDALEDAGKWIFPSRNKIHSLDKGFFPRPSITPFDRPTLTDERGDLTAYQTQTIEEILDYCDREKLQILFIVCPYIMSESDCKALNTCADIVQSRGYPFVNFNYYYDEIGLNFETDFHDVNHVNYLGAQKYSAYLIDYISSHYDLPDHRNDETFSAWNEDYSEYQKLQAQWLEETNDFVNRMLDAKEIGERLPNVDDFATWFDLIQNENFTCIIKGEQCAPSDIKDPITRSEYNQLLSAWEMDAEQPNYLGVWCGKTPFCFTNEPDCLVTEIGVDGGRGRIPLVLENESNPRITIDGINYQNDLGGIQVVVFDNNYQKVVDNVNILVEEDCIRLVRDPKGI